MRKQFDLNKTIKVYIASPYTGDEERNVKFQIDVAEILMEFGYAPYVPLLSHYQHAIHPRNYNDWIELDLIWVKQCDCVLRLGGTSPGADGEVKLANDLKIPVFYTVETLNRFYDDSSKNNTKGSK